MKPLVVIPARGGSKGVPGKNIKHLGGKPMVHYTIEAAQEVFDSKVICVTTDSVAIKAVAEETKIAVPFLRPAALSSDTAGTYEVLLHAIDFYEQQGYFSDTLILLQPTSPFRTAKQIREALALYTENLDMVVSVKETKANPYYLLFEEDKEGFLQKSKEAHFIRRQDCPKVWELNGAIYIINVASLKKNQMNTFKKVLKYEMDEYSSHDIDTMFDWNIAELIIEKHNDYQ